MARSILDRQADELVLMAGAIIGRLSLGRRRPDVVLAGGPTQGLARSVAAHALTN